MKLCITKGKKICFYFLLLSTCTNFAKQMAKQKTYVVFVGRNPGIYDSWDECKMMTDNFPGAKFKAFSNRTEAILAYREREDDADSLLRTISEHLKQEEEARPDVMPVKTQNTAKSYPPEVVLDSIAVDAGCQGNPGRMDYRGVYVRTGKEIFHVGPYPNGTNNIGEFLAIVHALALLKQKGSNMPIYSDSLIAQKWIRIRQCRTSLKPNNKNTELLAVVARAEKWLAENTFTNRIMKWKTEEWGEIPADFGRK